MAFVQETYKLPSNGKLGENSPTEVTIRNITTREEKLLLGSSNDALDQILSACIVEPKGLDINSLLGADKHFILYKLRIISYGPIYHVTAKCPSCGRESEYKIDLDDLEVNYLPDDFEEPYSTIVLPRTKSKVALKIPREADLIKARDKARRYNKKFPESKGDINYIYNLMTNIATIDGKEVTSQRDLQKFIEDLPGYDSAFLKNEISKVKVGLDTELIEECPHCGEDVQFVVPITSEFFRTRFDD